LNTDFAVRLGLRTDLALVNGKVSQVSASIADDGTIALGTVLTIRHTFIAGLTYSIFEE